MIKRTLKYAFPILLVFTLFIGLFSVKLIPLFIVLTVFSWLFFYRDFSKFTEVRKFLVPFGTYCLIFLAAFLGSENKLAALKELERFVSFLVFPIIILCSKLKFSDIRKIEKGIIYVTLFIALLSIIVLLIFALNNQEFLTRMDETYPQWKLPHLMGFHPSYFGSIIVITTYILLFEDAIIISKKVNILLAVILSGYLFYLSPRMAIISQILLWIFYFIFYFKVKKTFKLLLIVVCCGSLFFFFNSSNFFTKKIKKSLTDDRFVLWEPAYEVMKSNYFLFGEGLKDGENIFKKHLKENGDKRINLKGSTDLHNQYLENYVSAGSFGFFALCFLLFNPFLQTKKRSLLFLALLFSFALFTESMLNIIKGIVMFNIFYSIFILKEFLEIHPK